MVCYRSDTKGSFVLSLLETCLLLFLGSVSGVGRRLECARQLAKQGGFPVHCHDKRTYKLSTQLEIGLMFNLIDATMYDL